MIAIYESRNREEQKSHSNFKVLLYNENGKAKVVCDELKHQEVHEKLLKKTYENELQKENRKNTPVSAKASKMIKKT